MRASGTQGGHTGARQVERSVTMTLDEGSGIGEEARGPIPSAVRDTWCHRREGIGRRLLIRKNRNKEKGECRTPKQDRHASTHGNPFKNDRTTH